MHILGLIFDQVIRCQLGCPYPIARFPSSMPTSNPWLQLPEWWQWWPCSCVPTTRMENLTGIPGSQLQPLTSRQALSRELIGGWQPSLSLCPFLYPLVNACTKISWRKTSCTPRGAWIQQILMSLSSLIFLGRSPREPTSRQRNNQHENTNSCLIFQSKLGNYIMPRKALS